VLLKNNDSLLPLSPTSRILVTGAGADNLVMQSGGWTVTWQGDNTSNVDFPGATSILHGIKSAISHSTGVVDYHSQGEYKVKPDVAIVVFGEQAYAEAKGDIEDLFFKTDDFKILERLYRDGIPTVSILLSGRPLFVTEQINRSTAFIAAWLPGSEGQGIADVIFTDDSAGIAYDFQGKISFSWPKSADQAPHNLGDNNYQPLFPYGYGLNYTDQTNLPWFVEQ
jgi:beta-glucosidase